MASTLGDNPIEPPFLCLVASGGHTFVARVDEPASYTVLGQTLDDAAGEAFDKGARLLGLGYPGGPALDKLAQTGDPEAFDFPRSQPGERPRLLLLGPQDVAALQGRATSGRSEAERRKADLAASYQRAIVDSLVDARRAGTRARPA